MTTTHNSRTEPENPEIAELAQRMRAWRANRIAGQRIPAELWQAAVQLARVHGLNPIASQLKLNYYDLRRRVQPRPAAKAKSARFVELPAVGSQPPGGDFGTLEVQRPSGAKLTLRMPHAQPKQLLPWVQAFLRA